MLLVIFLLVANAVAGQPCPHKFYEHNDECFYISKMASTFYNAHATCKDMGELLLLLLLLFLLLLLLWWLLLLLWWLLSLLLSLLMKREVK